MVGRVIFIVLLCWCYPAFVRATQSLGIVVMVHSDPVYGENVLEHLVHQLSSGTLTGSTPPGAVDIVLAPVLPYVTDEQRRRLDVMINLGQSWLNPRINNTRSEQGGDTSVISDVRVRGVRLGGVRHATIDVGMALTAAVEEMRESVQTVVVVDDRVRPQLDVVWNMVERLIDSPHIEGIGGKLLEGYDRTRVHYCGTAFGLAKHPASGSKLRDAWWSQGPAEDEHNLLHPYYKWQGVHWQDKRASFGWDDDLSTNRASTVPAAEKDAALVAPGLAPTAFVSLALLVVRRSALTQALQEGERKKIRYESRAFAEADLSLRLNPSMADTGGWRMQSQFAGVYFSEGEADDDVMQYEDDVKMFNDEWGKQLARHLYAKTHGNDVVVVRPVEIVWNMECGLGAVLGFTTEALGYVIELERLWMDLLIDLRVEVNGVDQCLNDLRALRLPAYQRQAMTRLLRKCERKFRWFEELEEAAQTPEEGAEAEAVHNATSTFTASNGSGASGGSGQHDGDVEQHVTVIHRDPGRYQSFKWSARQGSVLIGRSMYESDSIPSDWVENINTIVDKVWVPSSFNQDTFHGAGVHANWIRVLPESVDTFHFDREAVSLVPPPTSIGESSSSADQNRHNHDQFDHLNHNEHVRSVQHEKSAHYERIQEDHAHKDQDSTRARGQEGETGDENGKIDDSLRRRHLLAEARQWRQDWLAQHALVPQCEWGLVGKNHTMETANGPVVSCALEEPTQYVVDCAADAFVFLSIGKNERRKNWQLLLRAFVEEFARVGEESSACGTALIVKTNLKGEGESARIAAFMARAVRAAMVEHSVDTVSGEVDTHPAEAMPTTLFAVGESHQLPSQRAATGRTIAGGELKQGESGSMVWHDLVLPPIFLVDEVVGSNELPLLYSSASSVVSASRGEGWGLPLVEAMAMQVPVIAGNFSGNTEFVRHGETGWLVPVHSMTSLLVDRDENGPDTCREILPGDEPWDEVDLAANVNHQDTLFAHRWACLSRKALRDTMVYVKSHHTQVDAVARQGREMVHREFRPDVVARRIARLARDALAERGHVDDEKTNGGIGAAGKKVHITIVED